MVSLPLSIGVSAGSYRQTCIRGMISGRRTSPVGLPRVRLESERTPLLSVTAARLVIWPEQPVTIAVLPPLSVGPSSTDLIQARLPTHAYTASKGFL